MQSVNRTIKSLNFPIIKNNSHQYEYSHEIRVIQNDIYYILKLIRLTCSYVPLNNNLINTSTNNIWNDPKKLKRQELPQIPKSKYQSWKMAKRLHGLPQSTKIISRS
ncbi:unnamed protein product [Rhizophagus irregularis]|nr:unnamed protein product [Rhizophagus irregularis]